ncbi:MAG: hypothetical protein ACKOSO_07395, partial [Actinomycetota bacterium]
MPDTLGAALRGGRPAPASQRGPMLADREVLGALVAQAADGRAFSRDERELAASIAAQVAVGIKKIRLIEGLEERNLIKDFFADLAAGRLADGLPGRARRLGCDFAQPKLAVVALGWRDATDDERARALERFRSALGKALPGVLVDQRDEEAVALVPALGEDEAETLRRLERALGEGAARLPLVVGVSSPCVVLAQPAQRLALAVAGVAVEGHAQQGLVGAEAVVRDDGGMVDDDRRGERRPLAERAFEPPQRLRLVLAERGHQRHSLLVAQAADGRAFSPDERELAASIAAQVAVGIKKIRLIEGLEERNLIKDFFAD